MSEKERCLVIGSQPIVRLGVRRLLASRFDVEEAECGEVALQLITDVGDFDVAIVDMRRGPDKDAAPMSGEATIRALLKVQPSLGIVAHGGRSARHVAREAMAAGATAYVAKSSPLEDLRRAVDAALEAERFLDPEADGAPRSGKNPRVLTKRQREILQLIADGHRVPQIAKRLGLSTETVKTHTKQILARLGARSQAHSVAIGMRNSLID
jgi:DNA-binding NarL/FixJ family response regulator